jgi:Na+(H+)/acetate symporter ActP
VTPRRRAETLGTLSKIVFALVAPFVLAALLAVAALLIICVPAWLAALVSGDLTKRAHEAWDALSFEEQQ